MRSENWEFIPEKEEEENEDFEIKWIKNEEISVLIKQLEAQLSENKVETLASNFFDKLDIYNIPYESYKKEKSDLYIIKYKRAINQYKELINQKQAEMSIKKKLLKQKPQKFNPSVLKVSNFVQKLQQNKEEMFFTH